MDSSFHISKMLLKNYTTEQINDYLNVQKFNETINIKFKNAKNYEELLKITDWIPILTSDSENKSKSVKQVTLW